MNEDDISVPEIDHWRELTLEIYCTLNWDYYKVCSEHNYILDADGDFEEVPNPHYNPNIKPAPWPEGCKRELGIDCIECLHCAYCEADEGDD